MDTKYFAGFDSNNKPYILIEEKDLCALEKSQRDTLVPVNSGEERKNISEQIKTQGTQRNFKKLTSLST